ncbi:MAG: GNAT family N-acetyltransferase [Bacteroides sp.]|nr:GNAT family N-acetyltransferase [Bacteroides sp.]MCM1380169.1 GNAT family N-acetyltransferase [Bacteroides sp.]MCM1446482.1 GNAT family N-acetyltransferase [Prevotella sp.]
MNAPVIDPVPVELLKAELTPERFLRHSNRGGNDLYVVDAHSAPNVMREIGRLREIAFRLGGGGTGKEVDIDEFDTMTPPLKQLVVWNPQTEQIVGGYRYILGRDVQLEIDGSPRIATGHMFRFSKKFMEEYMPYTIELGRSFVRIEAQATRSSSAIYALDNLWDGIGALFVKHPEIKYLFGKVTMYPDYQRECRDLILHFFKRHFRDDDKLVTPIIPLNTDTDTERLNKLLPESGSFREDYVRLNHLIREHGINIPPLVNAYMNLSPTMRYFGTAINPEFGDVEESAILVTFEEITEDKRKRHIDSYDEKSRQF